MNARFELKKEISGRESQRTWRQDELIVTNNKVTLTLTLICSQRIVGGIEKENQCLGV
jgi:hypothetical protein